MGTLVFQATLGGAVNIIGPNIANTINFTLPSADGTSGQTWTTNGSGVLSFGTLGIAGGGTGQITATAAFNALAPSQSGQSGKYLTTDGTNTSWGTNPLGTVTSVAATVPSFLSIAGSPITTSGTLAFTLSGTALPTTSGGTGLTSFTSGGVVYASSTSALATGSALVFDGTNLGIGASTPADALNVGTAKKFRATHSASVYQQIFSSASGNFYNAIGDNFQLTADVGAIYLTTTASQPMVFQTSNTDRVTINGAGNVGIGTSSPSCSLDVTKAAGANFVATFQNTTAATPYCVFIKDAASSASGYPLLAVTNSTGSATYFRVDSSVGTVGIGTTPNASASDGVLKLSGGITFPATQSASSNANTLDDYEEGTWTPVLGGTGGTSGQTYSYQVGRYTKIGRQVICSFEAALSAVGTVTDYAAISGLPFTSTGTSTNLDAGGCLITFASGLATNQIYITAYIFDGETKAWVTGTAAAGTAIGNITATNIWGNSARIAGTISYTAS
jgi:hypothetical protein